MTLSADELKRLAAEQASATAAAIRHGGEEMVAGRVDLAEKVLRKFGQAAPPIDSEALTALLDDVRRFLGRFVAYPSEHAQLAHTLWIAHTHVMDAWESTPRLAFLSPEPGSGKTRALEVSELLVPRPIEAINATPAYLFRKVSDEAGPPTILFDEIDTLFGARAKENEEIRGILNAGHRRGAMAGRCVVKGKTVTTEELPAYCAVAVAGLGNLPDTILTRSVVIRMRRRAPNERVEPYRRRVHAPQGHALRERLVDWAAMACPALQAARPVMPGGVEDRAADVWEALLAIADAAGGEWPATARAAAVTLVTAARDSTPSLGVRLLADLRRIFGDTEAKSTELILRELIDLEESPWGDLRGKPLDARRLSGYLRPYSITPRLVRIGSTVARGYARTDLWDTWIRYLPPLEPAEHVTSVTAVTLRSGCSGGVTDSVTDGQSASVTDSLGNPAAVTDVTDVTGAAAPAWEAF